MSRGNFRPAKAALRAGGRGPLYRRLVGSLNARILKGALATGAQLPSERELSEQFGVSRATVRQALEHLSRAGRLKKVQGRGTFVAGHGPITQPLAHVTAFRDAIAARGMTPALRIVSRTQEPSDYVLSRVLGVPPDSPVAHLVYLGLGDGEPLVLYRSSFPAAKLGEALDAFCRTAPSDSAPQMPAEVYARRAGILELKAEQRFEARLATPEEAGLLAVRLPASVLHVTSLISGAGGAVEYRQAVYRGDRYWFNMERSLSL
jgi:DNA-binding GntR family transcriptional regulator